MNQTLKRSISPSLAGLSGLLVILFLVCTSERNNPLDPGNPNYVPPSISIDTTGANVSKGDTISTDSATITVTGNREVSVFRARIDSGSWSQWQSSGVLGYGSLTSGSHVVTIESKYEGWDLVVSDSVAFFVQRNAYTVTYDGNNNTSGTAPLSQTKTQGIALTLAANTGSLVRTGFTFAGWNTAASGSGTDYIVGASYTADTADTLYAKWTSLPTYTVTYDGNGSTGGTVPSSQTKTLGISLTLAANTGSLVRTGFAFAGWNTAANGGGTDYAVGASYTADAAVTLYAKWTPVYTVTYAKTSGVAGSVPVDGSVYPIGATASVLSNSGNPVLTKTGYVFSGWNTDSTGVAGTARAAGSTFTMGSANVVLYAQWLSIVNIAAIQGVTAPVMGATPVTTMTPTTQYTGTVSWSPAVASTFAAATVYTATITLTANSGFTFSGVGANFYTVTGAAATNAANTGSVAALFPATFGADYSSSKIGILKYVPAGTFQRDATAGNTSKVSAAFRMSEKEITRAQFLAIMGTDPSDPGFSSGTADPVQQANWYHAIAFCNKLSIAEGLTPVYTVSGVDFAALTYADIPTVSNTTWDAATCTRSNSGYRLPTEMEWMWAAMGATAGGATVSTTGYSKVFAGSTGSNAVGNYAWTRENSNTMTHPVGTKLSNELGLYDMSGNVWEWCWDWYGAYPTGANTDFMGADTGTSRVDRGGSWDNYASNCPVAYRNRSGPYYQYFNPGFRVVRP